MAEYETEAAECIGEAVRCGDRGPDSADSHTERIGRLWLPPESSAVSAV